MDTDRTAPSLIWIHTVCLYAKNRFEKFARIFSRRHKQTTVSDADFLGILRVKVLSKFTADNLKLCHFSEKIRLGISCELSARLIIYTKCQDLLYTRKLNLWGYTVLTLSVRISVRVLRFGPCRESSN